MRNSTLCLAISALLITIVSCKKSVEYGDVCQGLLQTGTADSVKLRLKGDWAFKYFAYTPNGKDITYKEPVQYGILRAYGSDTVDFYYSNQIGFRPRFSGANNITMQGLYQTLVYSLKEKPFEYVFWNTICYSIKDDVLYIHYNEQDGKNLFILQRK